MKTAVEVRARIEEMKQNLAAPRVQETWSKVAPRVKKAPTREEMETFIEQQRTIRETRAAMKDQEAKRLQVETRKKRA